MKLSTTKSRTEPTRRGHGGSRTRGIGAAGAAVALAAALLTVSPSAQGLNDNRTGALDARGFPTHFTDDSGISLAICEDGTANCLGATTADLADTTDGEAFYWMATATVPSSRGDLSVEFALEAAFAATDQPQVFERIRIRGDLTRAGRYTLQHPYGRTRFDAASPAQQRNVNFTQDTPCTLGANSACRGPLTSFLRARNAPTGYLGGGETLSRVTGGTARNELVLRAPGGAVIGRTGQFAIVGKLAPGPAAVLSTDAVDFGNTKRARTRRVTVRNLGDAALELTAVRVAGANTIRLARTGCAVRDTLPSGASCRATLRYRPTGKRSSAARLVVDDNTIAGIHRIPARAMTAAEFSSRRGVHFRARRVGTTSRVRRVLVDNTGVVPMRIKRVSLAGGNKRSFDRRSGNGPLCRKGARVRPGRSCAVYVAFRPRTFGPKTSSLLIRTNAVSSPDRIRLGGRGR